VISTKVRGQRVERRPGGGARPTPRRVPELAHLSIDELRDYRQELVAEETRVSYWRRILQARLDLVIDANDNAALKRLRGVLHEHADSSRRLAMLPVADAAEAPPLPDLTVLWETPSTADGPDASLVARMADAEQQLSSYRNSLHLRLDDATGELIARYRDEPALALRALPMRRQRTA
jgi:hypothetical protein